MSTFFFFFNILQIKLKQGFPNIWYGAFQFQFFFLFFVHFFFFFSTLLLLLFSCSAATALLSLLLLLPTLMLMLIVGARVLIYIKLRINFTGSFLQFLSSKQTLILPNQKLFELLSLYIYKHIPTHAHKHTHQIPIQKCKCTIYLSTGEQPNFLTPKNSLIFLSSLCDLFNASIYPQLQQRTLTLKYNKDNWLMKPYINVTTLT